MLEEHVSLVASYVAIANMYIFLVYCGIYHIDETGLKRILLHFIYLVLSSLNRKHIDKSTCITRQE